MWSVAGVRVILDPLLCYSSVKGKRDGSCKTENT